MASQASQASSSSQPNYHILSGTVPGQLDKSQPARLLRFAHSTLSFASFDPLTAHSGAEVPNVRSLTLDEEQPRPKRIVIETTPQGAKYWRFVPRARLDEGITNEGSWPRLVDVCGQRVYCDQDQWDIYKLDPSYQCVVKSGNTLPSITKVGPSEPEIEDFAEPANRKRRTFSAKDISMQDVSKHRRIDPNAEVDDDDEENEVRSMIVDDVPQATYAARKRAAELHRKEVHKRREQRWQENKQFQQRYASAEESQRSPALADASMIDLTDESQPSGSQDTKRKGVPDDGPDMPPTPTTDYPRTYAPGRKGKRTRTVSPQSIRQQWDEKRAGFQSRKRTKVRGINEDHHHAHHYGLWEELREQYGTKQQRRPGRTRATTEDPWSAGQSQDGQNTQSSSDTQVEDPEREAHISESIRKMSELNEDRPLWEEERQKRETRERAEELTRRAKAEERKKAEVQREREVQLDQEAEERRRAEEEDKKKAEKSEQQRAARKQRRERWNSGVWTIQRALERYKIMGEEFDSETFGPDSPVTFYDIPWPVLYAPNRFTVEDIDWSAIEKFFESVRGHMRPQDFKEFVERSHRRFHPDRWSARKLWSAVMDEEESNYIEVAGKAASQAITPLWRDLKRR